jgi:hypothetical protein
MEARRSYETRDGFKRTIECHIAEDSSLCDVPCFITCSTVFRATLRPIHLPIQRIEDALSSGVQGPGSEADHLPQPLFKHRTNFTALHQRKTTSRMSVGNARNKSHNEQPRNVYVGCSMHQTLVQDEKEGTHCIGKTGAGYWAEITKAREHTGDLVREGRKQDMWVRLSP